MNGRGSLALLEALRSATRDLARALSPHSTAIGATFTSHAHSFRIPPPRWGRLDLKRDKRLPRALSPACCLRQGAPWVPVDRRGALFALCSVYMACVSFGGD